MDKIIVTFHAFDGALIKRAVTFVGDRACINPVRAISRLFSGALYQAERDNTYTATLHWEYSKLTDVYNYVPLAKGLAADWVWESSYAHTQAKFHLNA